MITGLCSRYMAQPVSILTAASGRPESTYGRRHHPAAETLPVPERLRIDRMEEFAVVEHLTPVAIINEVADVLDESA